MINRLLNNFCGFQSKKNIYKIIGRIISGRRNTGTVGARKDMLDCLLTAQSEDGTPKYSESFIADQVNVMLVAGVGTSATQLSFLLKYLVENPDVVLLLKVPKFSTLACLASQTTVVDQALQS